ncbi:hypothetical protein CB1_001951011 [Camelus ferus]|nr:hypothetical protein CB1_001951011 [Camelus ferus]
MSQQQWCNRTVLCLRIASLYGRVSKTLCKEAEGHGGRTPRTPSAEGHGGHTPRTSSARGPPVPKGTGACRPRVCVLGWMKPSCEAASGESSICDQWKQSAGKYSEEKLWGRGLVRLLMATDNVFSHSCKVYLAAQVARPQPALPEETAWRRPAILTPRLDWTREMTVW